MPAQSQSPEPTQNTSTFNVASVIFGPIRPAAELNRRTTTAIKAHSSGKDYFTEITLQQNRQNPSRRGMQIEYTVTAKSPASATRVGIVYLSQLCDLLSAVTQCPVWFCMPDEDARDEHIRLNRQSTNVERELTENEWMWITGTLAHLRRKHPRFLAAASWYRKGLLGRDTLDDYCCFWRSIERLSLSYADKSDWDDTDRQRPPIKKCISQLTTDIFDDTKRPEILSDPAELNEMYRLRCEISHGNLPITPELIESVDCYIEPLEEAAYRVLSAMREKHLPLEEPR